MLTEAPPITGMLPADPGDETHHMEYIKQMLQTYAPVHFESFIRWFVNHQLPRDTKERSFIDRGVPYPRSIVGVGEYIEDLIQEQVRRIDRARVAANKPLLMDDEDDMGAAGAILNEIQDKIMGQFHQEYMTYRKALNKSNPGVPEDF